MTQFIEELTYADAYSMIADPLNCFEAVTAKQHMSLSPRFISKVAEGIHETIRKDLRLYSDKLQGVPVAYNRPRLVQKSAYMIDYNPYMHFDVEVDYVVFKPQVGSVLLGCVNKLAEDHVGLLVHQTFNASIHKPRWQSVEWAGSHMSSGQPIKFKVTKLRAKHGLVSIYGDVLAEEIKHSDVPVIDKKRKRLESETVSLDSPVTVETSDVKKKLKKRKRESSLLDSVEGGPCHGFDVSNETSETTALEQPVSSETSETGALEQPVSSGDVHSSSKKKRKKHKKSIDSVSDMTSVGDSLGKSHNTCSSDSQEYFSASTHISPPKDDIHQFNPEARENCSVSVGNGSVIREDNLAEDVDSSDGSKLANSKSKSPKKRKSQQEELVEAGLNISTGHMINHLTESGDSPKKKKKKKRKKVDEEASRLECTVVNKDIADVMPGCADTVNSLSDNNSTIEQYRAIERGDNSVTCDSHHQSEGDIIVKKKSKKKKKQRIKDDEVADETASGGLPLHGVQSRCNDTDLAGHMTQLSQDSGVDMHSPALSQSIESSTSSSKKKKKKKSKSQ